MHGGDTVHRRRRPKYTYTKPVPGKKQRKGVAQDIAGFVLLLVMIALVVGGAFLKSLSAEIAVSDACDVTTDEVNRAVRDILAEGDYTGDYFVSFEKNAEGAVTAISCNMSRINTLSTQILDRVIGATETRTLTVEIPIGNLTGINLLMGRGPKVPVKIIMLSSSRVEFSNDIITAGINQTKHQITLNVVVDIDILIPWGTESAQVVTPVMIADTVIVGQVPDTYLNMN